MTIKLILNSLDLQHMAPIIRCLLPCSWEALHTGPPQPSTQFFTTLRPPTLPQTTVKILPWSQGRLTSTLGWREEKTKNDNSKQEKKQIYQSESSKKEVETLWFLFLWFTDWYIPKSTETTNHKELRIGLFKLYWQKDVEIWLHK